MPKNKNIPFQSVLNAKYRFDNFIKKDSNEESLSAGFFVSHNPGQKLFNPLFIYGDDGLGKTHLAHAIGNAIRERFPHKKILCITTEYFCQRCLEAVENNIWDKLVNWLQAKDVIVLEDIQLLSGQTAGQEMILLISDIFIQKVKQIVITADRVLLDMQNINPHLLSRFKSGIMVELHQPDCQIKTSLLKK